MKLEAPEEYEKDISYKNQLSPEEFQKLWAEFTDDKKKEIILRYKKLDKQFLLKNVQNFKPTGKGGERMKKFLEKKHTDDLKEIEKDFPKEEKYLRKICLEPILFIDFKNQIVEITGWDIHIYFKDGSQQKTKLDAVDVKDIKNVSFNQRGDIWLSSEKEIEYTPR